MFRKVESLPLRSVAGIIFLQRRCGTPIVHQHFLFQFALTHHPVAYILLVCFECPIFQFLRIDYLQISQPYIPGSLFGTHLPFRSNHSYIGLWSRSAIAEAPQKSNRDKNNPSIAKSLEIFLITSFDSGKLTLGMK